MYTTCYLDTIYIIIKLYRIICFFYILLKFLPLVSKNLIITYLTIYISQPFFKFVKDTISYLKLTNRVKGYFFLFVYFTILNKIVGVIHYIKNFN